GCLAAVAGAAHVTRLRRFGPTSGSFQLYSDYDASVGLDEEVLARFCRAPHLRTLTALNLSQCPLAHMDRDRLAALIAEATFAPGLRRLALAYSRLTERGLRRVAGASELRALRKLALTANTESASAWQELFHSEALNRVTDLALSSIHLAQYVGSPAAGRTRSLTIDSCADQRRSARGDRRLWEQ